MDDFEKWLEQYATPEEKDRYHFWSGFQKAIAAKNNPEQNSNPAPSDQEPDSTTHEARSNDNAPHYHHHTLDFPDTDRCPCCDAGVPRKTKTD